MKKNLFFVVSVFITLFVTTSANAVEILTSTQLQGQYSAGYKINTTYYIERIAESTYYFSGDSILNVVPVNDGVLTLDFYPDHVENHDINRQLPSEPGLSYIVTLRGMGEVTWGGTTLLPDDILVDHGAFTGRVDFNLAMGSVATVSVVEFNSVPEPAHFSIAAAGLLGFGVWYRIRKKQ